MPRRVLAGLYGSCLWGIEGCVWDGEAGGVGGLAADGPGWDVQAWGLIPDTLGVLLHLPVKWG